MKYLILLFFLSSCTTKYVDCFDRQEDIAKYAHSCPKAGHGICPFCEEITVLKNP